MKTNYDFDLLDREYHIEFAFGCRHKDSQKGSWDRAFVVVKEFGNPSITASYFDNGMDFIGHPKSVNQAIKDYNRYIEMKDWIRMNVTDIEKTSGVTINPDTAICPTMYNTNHQITKCIGATIILCIVIGFVGSMTINNNFHNMCL